MSEAMPEAAPTPTPDIAPEPELPAQEPVWKAESRKWEQRSKENKSALDEMTSKYAASELERGELAVKVSTHEAGRDLAALISEVASAASVPASALRGTTREDLEAHAAILADLIKPSGPVIPGQELIPGTVTDNPLREFARGVFRDTSSE